MEGLKDKENEPKCCKFIECQHTGNKYTDNQTERLNRTDRNAVNTVNDGLNDGCVNTELCFTLLTSVKCLQRNVFVIRLLFGMIFRREVITQSDVKACPKSARGILPLVLMKI